MSRVEDTFLSAFDCRWDSKRFILLTLPHDCGNILWFCCFLERLKTVLSFWWIEVVYQLYLNNIHAVFKGCFLCVTYDFSTYKWSPSAFLYRMSILVYAIQNWYQWLSELVLTWFMVRIAEAILLKGFSQRFCWVRQNMWTKSIMYQPLITVKLE